MPLLKYALILLPAALVGVFAYYRTLLWIGESVGLKWLRWILLMCVYLGFIVVWFGGTVFLMDWFLADASADTFLIALVMSCGFIMMSAVLSYKRYKTRLDAVGILFGRTPKP